MPTKQQETKREQVTRWLNDPATWVGVFQNADMSSPMVGHKLAMPFDVKDYQKVEVGARGPDALRKFGYIPWQYLLVAKCMKVEEVFIHIEE
jgi:hypothetical protein